MSADIEQRLAEAAQAVREHEVTSRRCSDLRARQDHMLAELAELQDRYAGERKDVDRLEGRSLARVLASMAGARDERLARERAEADAAWYRVAQARARLDEVSQEQLAAQQRLGQLASAPQAYAAALADKERYLTGSGDPRGRSLLALADERGRLTAELKEMTEAVRAAGAAAQALAQVQDRLASASGWSTYDTFFGGGAIASGIKHERMDEAAQAAAEADRRLAVLRTELADVHEPGAAVRELTLSGGTKFADVWLDNFFTDFAVQDRIRQARQNVDRSAQLVAGVQSGLTARVAEAQARLVSIEAERRDLLAR